MNYKWYTLAVYSGSESRVCTEIEKLSKENSNVKEVFIPTKKTFKIQKGKKVESTQKLFPNYIFVNMNYNRETLDSIRNMPRVMGFVGIDPLNPTMVPEEKIDEMKKNSEDMVVEEEDKLEIGDAIRIKEGHFESFNGVIEGRDENKNILKISITIFGRNTMIEIEPSKVEKV
jgi:transcriptional antiterminator NusG